MKAREAADVKHVVGRQTREHTRKDLKNAGLPRRVESNVRKKVRVAKHAVCLVHSIVVSVIDEAYV